MVPPSLREWGLVGTAQLVELDGSLGITRAGVWQSSIAPMHIELELRPQRTLPHSVLGLSLAQPPAIIHGHIRMKRAIWGLVAGEQGDLVAKVG